MGTVSKRETRDGGSGTAERDLAEGPAGRDPELGNQCPCGGTRPQRPQCCRRLCRRRPQGEQTCKPSAVERAELIVSRTYESVVRD